MSFKRKRRWWEWLYIPAEIVWEFLKLILRGLGAIIEGLTD